VVGVAVLLLQAEPSEAKKYRPSIIRCKTYHCSSPGVCVYPYTGNGFCAEGRDGPGFGQNVGCCCCDETVDTSNRWFYGE
jgi:hypothetical protein